MVRVMFIAGELVDFGSEPCLVVWPSLAGPQFGTFESYRAALPVPKDRFSDADWLIARDAARAYAEQYSIPFVVVVKNAQGT